MSEPTNETTSSQDRTPELTASERHELLAADLRRQVLEILAERDEQVDLKEVAAGVAVQSSNKPFVDREPVERVTISLHHVHLPKMDSWGVVDYDPETHRIDPVGVTTLTEPAEG